MAVCKPKPICTAARFRGARAYLRDQTHPNHVGHTIEVDPGCPDDGWLERIRRGIEQINRESGRKTKASNYGQILFVRFEDGAFLSKLERNKVADAFQGGLGKGDSVWHIDDLTGASDYNLILPSVLHDGPLPTLRRWSGQSLWVRAKEIARIVVRALNQIRGVEGRPPLRDLSRERIAGKASEKESLFPLRLASAARSLDQTVSVSSLPALLKHMDVSSDDWRLEEEWLHLRKGKRWLRLGLDDVLCASHDESLRLNIPTRWELSVPVIPPPVERILEQPRTLENPLLPGF
jgi:hypothetical protein